VRAGRHERVLRRGSQPEVVGAFWRGIDVFRPIALAYAVWSAWERQAEMVRPAVAWAVLAALGAWTLFVLLHRRRTTWLVVAEVALAAAAVMATRLVDSEQVIEAGSRTVPTFWPAAGVLSAAVLHGPRGGGLAALVIGAADLAEVRHPTAHTINNIVLLLLIGTLIGYSADLAREGHEKLREALTLEAQTVERERLARTVHDGVLQTLAYINRRGGELGGEAAELGGLAADQERRLRALVSGAALARPADLAPGEVDLRTSLTALGGASVHVVCPADPLPVRPEVATELTAAVEAALDNVRQHAGAGAQAWVLLDQEEGAVVVTVRDDGAGMAEDRLAEAAAAGRLGASTSIAGRLRDLGGEAQWRSRPGSGVTVRLRVPRGPGRVGAA
jgi:signal transduction histidine kinase